MSLSELLNCIALRSALTISRLLSYFHTISRSTAGTFHQRRFLIKTESHKSFWKQRRSGKVPMTLRTRERNDSQRTFGNEFLAVWKGAEAQQKRTSIVSSHDCDIKRTRQHLQ
jgi:hypothetical protein